jgi:UDP-N-acetyl-2-amino-2-deoxyglucuronate dehydrogenase
MTGEVVVRVGLIGCGKIAEVHALGLARAEGAAFVACCDVDAEKARALAAKHGVESVFSDAGELLGSGEVDAVVVCTPHPSHGPLVVAAAEAGVHVLCEKPITIDLVEADRMIAAAARADIRFGVIFQRRLWPAAQRLRRAIDCGKLGKLTLGECAVRIWRSEEYFASAPWRGTWANEGGGVLMNQAVHAIDQFQWFMGPAVEVSGRYATLRHAGYIDVEDTAVATVVFASGALGIIQAASSFNPNFGFRVAVHGDTNAAASVWERVEGRQGVNDVWSIPGEEEAAVGWEQAEANRPGFPEFHFLQIQDFIDAVREGREPVVTGAEARKSLELILAIYQSSRTGAPVTLPLTTGEAHSAQAEAAAIDRARPTATPPETALRAAP